MPSPFDERPNPLGNAAVKASTLWASLAGVIGGLVSFGVITQAQGDAISAAGGQVSPTITALGVVVGGVIPLVAAVLAAFRTAKVARPDVTPMEDPRMLINGELVPLVPVHGGLYNQSPEPDEGRHAK